MSDIFTLDTWLVHNETWQMHIYSVVEPELKKHLIRGNELLMEYRGLIKAMRENQKGGE